MEVIPASRLEALLKPYSTVDEGLLNNLGRYLDLLVRWNARTNLTAVRDPEEIVMRHFGESLFAAEHLPEAKTLLDLGSGAGFPGLPIQLAHSELSVTLAESQGKKSSFLREVIRTLELPTQVWTARAATLPRRFDVVTLRAVDKMEAALMEAASLALHAVVILTTDTFTGELPGFAFRPPVSIPGRRNQQLLTAIRQN